jgi:hypothetical protein
LASDYQGFASEHCRMVGIAEGFGEEAAIEKCKL